MSGTVAHGQADRQQAEAATDMAGGSASRRSRKVVAWLAAGVVAAGGAVAGWRAGAVDRHGSHGTAAASAPLTQPVLREDVAATTPVRATLGYAGSYTVRGQGGGTLTWLPQPGQLIVQGQVLYRVNNGSPVVLLYGSVPAWRPMSEGITGADVSQLNHDLVNLGYASRAEVAAAGWDYFSSGTAYAVQHLEEHLGVSFPPGSLALGQMVFEPHALRVSGATASLGGPASGAILAATSDRQVVTIALDASQESEVKAGDAVTVTLPDGTSTPGVITSVGTVASRSGPSATIPVSAKLTRPGAARSFDLGPVTVYITTATARDVLVVPVTALLARPGGYVVEVAGAGSTRRYVPVQVGPVFDDNSGMVQVTGALTPGQRVVVASS